MTDALPLSPLEVAIVFAPAIIAYAILTGIAVVSAGAPELGATRRVWRVTGWVLIAVVTLHVALLWSLRYGFDLAIAMRNGWVGFSVFHGAFALAWIVLPGRWRATRWRRYAIFVLWLLVTSGAVPAPFRYPIVRWLAPVVVAIALSGAVAMGVMAWRRRRRATPSAPIVAP